MRSFVIVILIVASSSWRLFSQPSETMKYLNPWQLKSFAKNSERVGDIYSAIDYYEELYKRKPDDIKIAYKLGQLYQQSRNYPVAEDYYSKVYDADKKAYPEALFYRALMKKMTGDYAGAREDFQQFAKETKKLTFAEDYKKRVKIELDGCDLADKFKEKPLDVFVLHLDTSINKAHVEMSPFPLTGNEILYASLKADKLFYIDAENDSAKMPTRQIYTAKRIGQKWHSEGLFNAPVNEVGVNVCNPALSPNGNKLFFNKCYPNWKNKMVCSIFMSEKVNNEWSDPVKLGNGINDSKYTSTQPTVGIDSRSQNEVLYFVSDREGGKGGLDIWYSIYDEKKNEFKEPKNVKKINTPQDEMTPFYDMETHTLYFSSNGWPSIGGLDIFKSQGELTQFSTPENVGYPINSSVDDLYYVVSKGRDGGFFVSNRKGTIALINETCCDDIFEYRWANFINVAVTCKIYAIKDSSIYQQLEKQVEVNNYIADLDSVSDKVNLLPNQRVDLYLIQDNNERIFIKSSETDDKGEYFFNLEPKKKYKIVVDNYGLFNKELSVSTTNITHSDTLHADAMYINVIPLEPVVIKNIYYEYGKWNLTDSSKLVLDTTVYKIMTQNPQIVVEISSHTDSVSSDDYNMKLSQKRAESVVNYLIDKGIAKERLVAKGYGKTKPIAPNTNPDGTDNPAGRQKNRRTEFKIIGSLDQYSKIIYEE